MTLLLIVLLFAVLAWAGPHLGTDSRLGPEWRWGEDLERYRPSH